MTTKLPASFLPAKFQVLSGSTLKLIAIILMLIDHTGLMILYNYPATTATLFSFGGVDYSWYRIFRDIGRAAFPIFCFLLVEGFLHTHNRKKYGLNLFLFACISEIPWNFMFTNTWRYEKQNVFFTLFLGYLAFCALEYFWDNQKMQLVCRAGTADCLCVSKGRLRMAGICIPADHVLVPQRQNRPGDHRKLLALL